ncbi:MAG: hypothetical protein CMA37_03740, partial [Euryarchaeota archaeon]|nr:hypothetical protein [Euryarchaeota archaeon]
MEEAPFEPVSEKKYATLEVKKSKKGYIAIGIVMLLIFVSMMTYMISTEEENNLVTDEESIAELGSWDTYYVESADGLPVCNEDTNGRLYYVESAESFETCTSAGWNTVEIKGKDGVNGQAGMNGQDVDEAYLQDLENDLLSLQLAIADLENQNSELNDALDDATSCQLVSYAYCAGADLSYMDLSGMDLSGINLRGANLQNTTFDYASLDGADLRSIVAMNATFIHTGMNDTYLQNAEFNRHSTSECGGYCGAANLSNADLNYSDLTGATLDNADLTNASLYQADLTNAGLYNADLTNASLNQADFIGATLNYGDLTNASLNQADLTDATLDYADLTNASLYQADLTDATLNYGDLTDASLSQADLTNAVLYYADLTDASLSQADLTNAVL